MGQTDSSGQHYMRRGMAGSEDRKDYDDMRFMEKASSKLLDRDKKAMKITAQEETKRVNKPNASKMKSTKRISAKR